MSKQIKNKLDMMHTRYALRMNIQFFAEGEEEDKKDPVNENMNKIITELKKDKEETQKKLDEAIKKNNELTEAVLNGGDIDSPNNKPVSNEERINTLRQELYGANRKDMSNLEYCKKTLELRQSLMDNGEDDPFLPHGKNIAPTDEDRSKAKNVATVMQECIEYAEESVEDPEGVFRNELMRRTKDAMPLANRKR